MLTLSCVCAWQIEEERLSKCRADTTTDLRNIEREAHPPTQLQRLVHINGDPNKGHSRENLILSIFKIWNL